MKSLAWLRSFFVIFFIFPVLTGVLCCAVLVNVFTVNSKHISDRIIFMWTKSVFILLGVRLKIHGIENMPQGGCLYLFNHASFWDIFTMYLLDPTLRFGAKIELFKIPLFGYTMRKTGTLPIPRENRAEAIRVYEDAERRAQAGERFALSPEGGRSGGPTLREFKSGPFIFGIRSKLQLVPVLIIGAEAVWPKGAIIPATQSLTTEVQVHVLAAEDSSKFQMETRVQLRDRVFERMNALYTQIHSKNN
jgi:1-acyl-sn-glycerol-3-phosphate acyltransferase